MRKEITVALQNNNLEEVKTGLNRIEKYSFFDSGNKQEARDLTEAMLHSLFSHEHGIKQAVLQANELKDVVNYDRSLKVVDLLKEIEIDSKPFCFYDNSHSFDKAVFRVKSRAFDWDVTSFSKSDERIPVEFARSLSYLKSKRVNISGIAIATPVTEKPLGEVVKETLQQEFHQAKSAGKKSLSVATQIISGVAESIASCYRTLRPLTDPILLIRIGSFYIEAGRWI